MKVLVMNCSPVRNGATAEIVNIVMGCLEKRYDVKSICIDDYDIKFCKGCRTCHSTAKCVQKDEVDKIIEQYELADIVVSVSPSYWADIPGQFKSFIDRCTPWCNTHEPHAKISSGMVAVAMANPNGDNAGSSCAFSPICWDRNGKCVDNTVLLADDKTEGVFYAEFDMEAIREYRNREMLGNTFRKVEAYGQLLSKGIKEPFIRDGQNR